MRTLDRLCKGFLPSVNPSTMQYGCKKIGRLLRYPCKMLTPRVRLPRNATCRLESEIASRKPRKIARFVQRSSPLPRVRAAPHELTRHATRLRTGPEILTPWFWSPVCQPVLQYPDFPKLP